MSLCTRTTIARFAIPSIAFAVAIGAAACGGEKKVVESSSPIQLADGAIIDADAEPIGDGWISGEAGSSDAGSDADAGPVCPGESAAALNTFIGANNYIQIDIDNAALDAGVVGANANLVVGPDNATNPASPSSNTPGPAGGNYIDWNSLNSGGFSLGNHRILDNFSGKDPSAFPGSNSCVGSANNPSKDELLSVGIANNNDYVYLNVLRASSLGDMGYTWLFTKNKPTCSTGGNNDNCPTFLRYHLVEGDVLVFGHFRTGEAKLLETYVAKAGVDTTLDAEIAIQWCNAAVWGLQSGVAAVAVNTDLTEAGIWNNAGLKDPETGFNGQPAFEDHIFAEGAVTTSTFGTNGVCGQTFWASVISKSSGNACSGADMKDLVGPRKVNFGAISVQAHVRPNCDGTVDLQATYTGTSGTVACTWYDGTTQIAHSPVCDEIVGVALTPGVAHSITVVASDGGDAGSGCGATSSPVSATPLSPIQVTLANPLTSDRVCAPSYANDVSDAVTFTASASGGNGNYNYTWTVQECTDPTDSSTCTTSACSSNPNPNQCTIDPDATDTCVYRKISVSVDDTSTVPNCPAASAGPRVYKKTITIHTE
ncbi:MAG: hypothetical protein HYV09_01600 [Deltaproteobacteria bacterium]|nr:hypothetical protein [Deltaproteobacteria bacterium]